MLGAETNCFLQFLNFGFMSVNVWHDSFRKNVSDIMGLLVYFFDEFRFNFVDLARQIFVLGIQPLMYRAYCIIKSVLKILPQILFQLFVIFRKEFLELLD